MTDAGLIAKKLVRIEACLRDLELVEPAQLQHDLIRERFVEHTLQIAIQAAIDIAGHIVADNRLGDAASNHELFDLLARHGWIPSEHVAVMHRMVGFRNILVHEYEDVDVQIVRAVVERHVGDLARFAEHVRARLSVT